MMLLWAALLLAAPGEAGQHVPPVAITAENDAPPSALEESRKSQLGQPILILSLAPEIGTRRVTYRDRISTGLAAYQSGAVGLLKLSAEIYPSRGRGLPIVSDIGLFGDTSRSLRSQAQFAPGTFYDDQWHEWDVGGRWRAIFSGEEWLALSIRYGSLSSQISGPKLTGVLLPSGTLQYWRPGLDLRFPIGPISISLFGGYLGVVVQDSIGHAFPRATSAGVDAGGKIALAISRYLELHISGRYTRFFYTLNPQPNDPFVAGGALDEYAVAELGLSLRI
jgi:hypothetical protein